MANTKGDIVLEDGKIKFKMAKPDDNTKPSKDDKIIKKEIKDLKKDNPSVEEIVFEGETFFYLSKLANFIDYSKREENLKAILSINGGFFPQERTDIYIHPFILDQIDELIRV